MISTINITSEAAVTGFAASASLGFIGIVILLLLLVQKEIVVSDSSPKAETFRQVLDIAITPMFLVFAFIVGAKLVEVLG